VTPKKRTKTKEYQMKRTNNNMVSLRLPAYQIAYLTSLSSYEGVSRSKLIKEALEALYGPNFG
jgi:predicted DNA-binding protein